jgi:hypothetical protein
VLEVLGQLERLSVDALLDARHQRLMGYGQYATT